MAGNIGEFEKVFEDLDVKVEEMNGALDGVYGSSIDNVEVNDLLAEMGSQQHMEEKDKMANAAGGQLQSSAQQQDVDDMQARLNQLKNL